MTPKHEAMLHWLNEHKREHEQMALGAMQHGGSQRYIQEQNEKAQIVEDIIRMVNGYCDMVDKAVEACAIPNSFSFTVVKEDAFAKGKGLKND